MNNNNDRIYELFKLVFNNIVIFNNIIKHIKIFKKNEKVGIDSRDELRLYKEREYIQSLIYYGKEMLIIGDLPNGGGGGVLKEIEFIKSELSSIKGDSIPNSVEILKFNPYYNIRTTPLSTLPKSIHTVKNITIFKQIIDHNSEYNNNSNTNNNNNNYGVFISKPPEISKDDEIEYDEKLYEIIPSNIKSISFKICPSISKNKHGYDFIIIPNTVEKLEFYSSWNNENIELSKGDIPEGVKSILMQGYNKILKKGVLPTTLKELNMNFNNSIVSGSARLFDEILPINSIEILTISDCNFNINSNLKLNQFLKIKKLNINYSQIKLYISPKSLPPNLIELLVLTNRGMGWNTSNSYFFIDSIPSSVKILKIDSIIIQAKILPESLSSLEIIHHKNSYYQKDSINLMITILPSSLTLLKLPKSFKEMKLNIPNHINVFYNSLEIN